MKINPERLQELRKRKPLTRQRLSDLAGIHVRTIQRLENDPDRCQKTREDTLNRLAEALEVEPGVLTGELPLPEFDKAPVVNSERVQIGAQIAPKVRLAYDLIKRRYGVSVTDIINMAPLFFALLAEDSLARRREKVKEACEALERLEQVDGFWRGSLVSSQVVMEGGFEREEHSIYKADIFGEHLFDNIFVDDYFDPTKDNPFASYLRKLADDLSNGSVVNVKRGDLILGLSWNFPDYNICSEELDRIANGSPHARRALEIGYARLSEIPEELMAEDAGEKRAEWLEGRLPDIYKIPEMGPLVEIAATSPQSDEAKEILEKIDPQKINFETEKGGDDQ